MPRFNHTTAKLGLLALLLVAVSACDQSAIAPEPEPQFEGRWDIDVVVRYVKASSEHTCDGTNLFGANNPGEYQYRIVASEGGITKSLQTDNYSSVLGRSHTLNTAEIHNFANRTWQFSNLTEDQGVLLTLYSTEWDGTVKDDDMNNRSNARKITPSTLLPVGGRSTDRALGVGTSTCGLTLYYDLEVAHREVPVE